MRTMIAVLLLCFCVVPAFAQAIHAPLYPDNDPTAAALAITDLPHHDRVVFSEQLVGAPVIAPPPTATPDYQIGDRQTFAIRDLASDEVFTVDASLRALGDHLVVWVEQGDTNLTDANVRDIAAAFDKNIYPNTRALWGEERSPGIDGDPRLHVLFVNAINAGFAAYYARENSYPDEIAPHSNEHEMFIFNSQVFINGFDLLITESILSHEFQHMIRDHIQPNLDNWLDEGLSEFTQHYRYGEVGAAYAFLAEPFTQLNAWNPEISSRGANYGAALLFVSYIYEHYGLPVLQAVSTTNTGRGLDAVDTALAEAGAPGINEVFADWVVANYLHDPTSYEGRYGYVTFPSNLPSPLPVAGTFTYPFHYDGQLAQYASDYVLLDNLGGVNSLTLDLTMPTITALIDSVPTSGERFWYSQRGDESAPTLTRSFDLRGLSSATLEYSIWYDLEASWDYGYLLVSVDNGETWQLLATDAMTDDDSFGVSYGAGYTGNSGGWEREQVSLDAFVGSEVLVRFAMVTDDAVTLSGLALDDVQVPELGYASDFEADDGGWVADGWIWVENRLPQRAWVQAIAVTNNGPIVTRWLAQGDDVFTLPLPANATQVIVAVSPFAPMTLSPMPYQLEVSTD